MKRIGLTGGFGSGKSTVMEILAKEAISVIDTDGIARELTAPGLPMIEHIRERFGDTVINHDGSLNRKRLAHIAFGDPKALKDLNAIMHPAISRIMKRSLDEKEKSGVPWTIIDVPLLYESGWDQDMDANIVVWAPLATCRQRLMKQRGFSSEEINQRFKSQWSLDEKKKRARYLIDNSGDLSQTRQQVQTLIKTLERDFPHAL